MQRHRVGLIVGKSALRDLAESITLPALELYTEGLFTDDATLTAYLHHRETT